MSAHTEPWIEPAKEFNAIITRGPIKAIGTVPLYMHKFASPKSTQRKITTINIAGKPTVKIAGNPIVSVLISRSLRKQKTKMMTTCSWFVAKNPVEERWHANAAPHVSADTHR